MSTQRFLNTDSSKPSIIYTHTDEAPALATYSLLPILRRFLKPADIPVHLYDISLSARILAQFYPEDVVNHLEELRSVVQRPDANIIKLPNISASVPQLNEAVAELHKQGYDKVKTYAEAKKLYNESVLGSVVNPVLREGNSDRRVAGPVKEHAKKYPHRMMKPFPTDRKSKAEVVHMESGDFYETERSVTLPEASKLKIVLKSESGEEIVLKEKISLKKGTIVDSAVMRVKKLNEFYKEHMASTKGDVLLSLHLKATMMKVSDPIMFGHAVKSYFESVFKKHAEIFEKLNVNPNNGLSDVYDKIHHSDAITQEQRQEIEADIFQVYEEMPKLAMVNSAKGITNLHVPSDVIVDASMPNVIRDGGAMWGPDDKLHDVKCMIPDRCYATMYKAILEDAQKHGQFDPSTMGTVANVGLMAQKAEEYGSHDKTFEVAQSGVVQVVNDKGEVLMETNVEKGDIWRACTTNEVAVHDWVKLAVSRGSLSGFPVIFWLDVNRAHDNEILKMIKSSKELKGDYEVMHPVDAMNKTCGLVREGKNAIAATGNVLRDYLTDLFPILELGTSAKMLSIVPFLNGGGMYETGAGGSAPKHVEQLLEENHLRWDSLGEFLAMAVSLEDLGQKTGKEEAKILGECLNTAVSKLLEKGKSPGRKVSQIDNRGSHFYLALYWAEALANQTKSETLRKEFEAMSKKLQASEKQISDDLIKCQGKPLDIGGYYHPSEELAIKAMRPSQTFNDIIGN